MQLSSISLAISRLAGGGSADYLLAKSLRFRASASAYLNRTPATATNRTTWTWSGWVKRGTLGVQNPLFFAGTAPSDYTLIQFRSIDEITLTQNAGSVSTAYLQSAAVFRDPAAWYHIVAVWNTTSATSTATGTTADRLQLWVNGVQLNSWDGSLIPAQNTTSFINNNTVHYLSRYDTTYLDGEMAEVNFVDGQALAPTAFGAYSIYNQWLPKKYTGTYGTNGFYLPFTNTASTSTLVADSSGNANNWTPNNISLTAGSTYDSLTDVPTLTSTTVANYAVLNPLFLSTWGGGSAAVPSNANLTIQDTTIAGRNSVGTISVNSGKWYFETQSYPGGTANNNVGIAPTNIPNPATVYFFGHYSASYASGSIIGVVLDFTALTIKFYVANVLVQTTSIVAGDYTPIFQVSSNNGSTATMHANFGQQPFTYTPPSGFLPLNTFNI